MLSLRSDFGQLSTEEFIIARVTDQPTKEFITARVTNQPTEEFITARVADQPMEEKYHDGHRQHHVITIESRGSLEDVFERAS